MARAARDRPALPTLDVLEEGLSAILTGRRAGVRVTERADNVYASTSASEVLRCRLPDGVERRLLCKYLSAATLTVDGRDIDPRYEIRVYRDVLERAPVRGPTFHGCWDEPGAPRSWLLIEFIDGLRLIHVGEPHQADAMESAARWIGLFHRHMAARSREPGLEFLRRRDGEHLRQRLERMLGTLGGTTEGLEAIRGRHDEVVALLVASEPTVIHGEYYPKNILVRDGQVHPVDWETAAIGPGVLDLASLTENWPAEIVTRCEQAYLAARHPEGAPPEFALALIAARLHWHVHWLGHAARPDRPKWSRCTTGAWRLEQLRELGERLAASRNGR